VSGLCIATAVLALSLQVDEFDLRWTHSVEKIEWREHWQVQGDHLLLAGAAVRGSGAGMEPADDAVFRDGWWTWSPRQPVPELHLAVSGATGRGWQLCTPAAGCRDLEEMMRLGGPTGEDLRLRPLAVVSSQAGAAAGRDTGVTCLPQEIGQDSAPREGPRSTTH